MTPDGIRVVEIDLALTGACYYLHWMFVGIEDSPTSRHTLLRTIHSTTDRLGWKVFAAGCNSCIVHLLFQTGEGDVNGGLVELLQNSRSHRLYLIQPETAFAPLVRHIQEQNDAGPYADPDREKELPKIHYGMFIGDGDWAEETLALLTQRAMAPSTENGDHKALHEIARKNIHRHKAILEAYRSGHYNLKDIAEHFGMHFSEVSAVINASATDGH